MTELARVAVALVADTEGFRRDMLRASQQFNAVGQQMRRAGAQLSAKVTAPLVAIGVASLKMAADAEEAANKFDVVMGDAADEVRARFRDLHETIPLTTSQMESAAASIQDMLVPMGVARERAAGMSADFVELAGDLASFNNVGTDQVLMAIGSALAGSSEPMRRFGVDTRVTRLEQIALAEGIIDTGEKLDNTTTALAVMAAIMSDSTDAMGDAERTAGSFSNQVRFLYRDVRELAIALGQELIPIILPLIERGRELVEAFADMTPEAKRLLVTAGLLAAALGPVLLVVGQLTMAVTGLGAVFALHPVGAFLTLAAAAAAALVTWKLATSESAKAMRDHRVALDEMQASIKAYEAALADLTRAELLHQQTVNTIQYAEVADRIRAVQAELMRDPSPELRRELELLEAQADSLVLRSVAVGEAMDGLTTTTESVAGAMSVARGSLGDIEDGLGLALTAIQRLESEMAQTRFDLLYERDTERIAEMNAALEEQGRILGEIKGDVKAFVDEYLRLNQVDFSGLPIPGTDPRLPPPRMGAVTPQAAPFDLDDVAADFKKLQDRLSALQETMRAAGGSTKAMREEAEFLQKQIDAVTREAFAALNDEIQHLRAQEAVVYQVADLADSLGLLSDRANGAVNAIGSVVRGIEAIKTAQTLSSLNLPGAGLASISGVAGIAVGFIGIMDSIFGGVDEEMQRHIAELERAKEEYKRVLDEWVDVLTDETRWEALEEGAVERAQEALTLLMQQIGTVPAEIRNLVDEGDIEGAIAALQAWFDEMVAAGTPGAEIARHFFGPEATAILDNYRKHLEQIHEEQQAQIDGMREEFEIRALIAQGLDEEAAARRREIAYQKDYQEAFDLGGQALADFVTEVYNLEEAAIEAAKAAQDAADVDAFMFDFNQLKFELDGNEEGALAARIAAQIDEEIARAQDLLDRELIDEETFNAWVEAVGERGARALDEFREAAEAAAEAARKAAAAERFRQMVDEENLRIRIMLARGENEAARQARNQLELIQAINDGRSAEYIRLLQIAHAEEERAIALDESRQALEETTRAINGVSNVLNGPAGLPFALLRARAALQQGMPAMPGVTGPGQGGSRFQSGPMVNNQPVTQNVDLTGLTIQYTGRESERELIDKVARAVVRGMKAGGVNPLTTNSAA